jgi:hypothetical protein
MVPNHPIMLVNSRKKRKISTRRTNLKTNVRGNERNPSSVTTVVVLIILQRSTKSPNTWSTYTRNASEARKAKESYEAHFNATFDEATTSGKRPNEAAKPSPSNDDYIDGENMIVEYNSNDMFGDEE